MNNRPSIKTLALCVALTGASAAMAQDALKTQDRDTTQLQTREQDRIYAEHLMSAQERKEYLERLRLAKTEQERERIRLEHREKMDLRLRALKSNGAEPAGMGMGKNQGGNAPILMPKQGSGRN